jgi:hypothetical protein
VERYGEREQDWKFQGFGGTRDRDEIAALTEDYPKRWLVEEMFRTVKTLLETRPIFHKCDETIRGHVFCSFLALLLRKELQDRLEAQGEKFEWAEVLRDLAALEYTEGESQGKRFQLRNDLASTTSAVFHAVGVAIPPSVQRLDE